MKTLFSPPPCSRPPLLLPSAAPLRLLPLSPLPASSSPQLRKWVSPPEEREGSEQQQPRGVGGPGEAGGGHVWTWTAAGRHRAWAPPPPSFPPGASSVRDSREERWEAPRRTEGSGPVGAQTVVRVRSRWAPAGASRWMPEAGGVRARLTRRGARRSGAGLCNPRKASRERLERRSSFPLPGGVQDFLASVFSTLTHTQPIPMSVRGWKEWGALERVP